MQKYKHDYNLKDITKYADEITYNKKMKNHVTNGQILYQKTKTQKLKANEFIYDKILNVLNVKEMLK